MNLPLVALVLVLLIAAWIFLHRRRSGNSDETGPLLRTSTAEPTFHAVSIIFSDNACNAAKELDGRRFLSSAAPRLPLAECDVLECSCRFVHHKDRRAGKDRRSPFSPKGFGAGTGKFEAEQRKAGDRRVEDDEDLF